MTLFTRLERLVQALGSSVSRRIFTDRVLARDFGQGGYLLLYGLFKRVFEMGELRALARFVAPGSTVVDVGANVGFMSVFFSNGVGPEGRVLAVEPDPVNVSLLERNLARHDCGNVLVVPAAVGDRDGEAVLYRNLANRADSRSHLDPETMPHRKEVTVAVRTLTSLLFEHAALPPVSLVKVDTQGDEVPVLKGMRAWLDSVETKPVLALECWPYGLGASGASVEALFEIVEDFGYGVPDGLRAWAAVRRGVGDYESALFLPRAEGAR